MAQPWQKSNPNTLLYGTDFWKLRVNAPVPYVHSFPGSTKWTYMIRYKNEDGKVKIQQNSGFLTWEEAAEARSTKMREMGLNG